MLLQLGKMRVELIEASNEAGGDIPIKVASSFADKTEKYVRMLREIDVVTRASWTRGHTLTACRDDLDTFIESIKQQKRDPISPLYNCKLGKQYIAPNASILQNPLFDNGVIKIQKGTAYDLLPNEKSGRNFEKLSCGYAGTG